MTPGRAGARCWRCWAPRGIEFPLEGRDLTAVTRHYVNLLREE
ncbi:Epimerase KguE [Cronobacter turicensis 564]|nr:Epimerase KguE [Cronobacter turicensis 564]